jgi:DNA modification methylase
MHEPTTRLMLGDCLDRMAEIADASVDCIVTDPPYPEIDRDYGRMTEAEWHVMMRGVVAHARRILKPSGSAVFILQPNTERAGRMRPWLWDFMAWTSREWGMVQDAYWWNCNAMPMGASTTCGLMRGSVKPCVWLGPPDCHRDQDAVLWTEADASRVFRLEERFNPLEGPSIQREQDTRRMRQRAIERGGVVPFNLLPIGNAHNHSEHGATTPFTLCDWWLRYLSPPYGTVCDPFMGSGTTGRAAVLRGLSFVGIERDTNYFSMAGYGIADALKPVSRLDPRPAYTPLPGQLDLFAEADRHAR